MPESKDLLPKTTAFIKANVKAGAAKLDESVYGVAKLAVAAAKTPFQQETQELSTGESLAGLGEAMYSVGSGIVNSASAALMITGQVIRSRARCVNDVWPDGLG